MIRTCDVIGIAGAVRTSRFFKAVFAILVAVVSALSSSGVIAAEKEGDAKAIEELYDRFVTAQNARDIEAVRKLLSAAPDFQWVSDGKVFWGRETMLQRMAAFQKSSVWRVEPDKHATRYVSLGSDSGFLFQPLTLIIGSETAPDRLQFIVNVMCKKEEGGWRIAGLFTTLQKP